MNPNFCRCLTLVLLVSAVGACGDAPLQDDAGTVDTGVSDSAHPDGDGAGECTDDDGDGHLAVPCGGDCDDADSTRFPGNTEICDNDDEDCNDSTYGADSDGDTFESDECCNGVGNCGTDCNDALNTVNPGAAEQCNGGVDDDCDGLADAADGVCVPCPGGYAGFDGGCVDLCVFRGTWTPESRACGHPGRRHVDTRSVAT
jgi:hypothetical protein